MTMKMMAIQIGKDKEMEELQINKKCFATLGARRQANVSLHISQRKSKHSLTSSYMKDTKSEFTNGMYVFNKTVRGKMHELKERPCEDWSDSFAEENGKYYIAIVADGHGSNECFLSRIGSKIAVDTALEALKSFATSVDAEIEAATVTETAATTDDNIKQLCNKHSLDSMLNSMLRPLTTYIVSQWRNEVELHYNSLLEATKDTDSSTDLGNDLKQIVGYPFSEAELQEIKNSKDKIVNPSSIYGTTLIAALWLLNKYLIIIHQGDGRCDVFFDDGEVKQPVPWDPRCMGTAVTSMCDEDAANRIRCCVINLLSETGKEYQESEKQKKVIACYLGSDGVEDAYRDSYDEKQENCIGSMEGVHTFYKDITCRIVEKGPDKFKSYLAEMLPEFSDTGKFSNTGSGDDVSVAGIVNILAVQNHIRDYEREIRIYELEEMLFWKEEELRSKMRKHGILKNRLDDAKGELVKIEDSILASKEKIRLAREKFDEAQKKFTDYDTNYQRIDNECKQIKSEIEKVLNSKIEDSKVNNALA